MKVLGLSADNECLPWCQPHCNHLSLLRLSSGALSSLLLV